MTNLLFVRENLLGNGHDGVLVGVRHVDDRQFAEAAAFRIILRIAFLDRHVALHLEELGEQLPDQEEDQPGMNDENAEFLFAQLKALNVGGN